MNKIIRRSAAVILAAFMLVSMTSCQLVDLVQDVVTEITKTPTSEFLSTFELDGDKDDLEYETTYDDYGEGIGNDGMALYKITVTDELKAQVEEWDETPLSDEAAELVEGLSDYFTIPDIENGNWKMVDREPEAEFLAEVSLAVYDADNGVVYFIKYDI